MFYIFPFIRGFVYSFTDWDGIQKAEFTGIDNFKEIFDPQKDQGFLPGFNTHYLFKENYELPFSIVASSYEGMLENHIKDPKEIEILKLTYRKLNSKKYILYDNLNEFTLYDKLINLVGAKSNQFNLIMKIIKESTFIETDIDTLLKNQDIFKNSTIRNINELKEILLCYQIIIKAKKIITRNLYSEEITFGALGFTLLYTLINVIFANLAAFLLAIFLEKQANFQKFFQSVFLIPSLLSLISLAFFWSLIFEKILPVITGGEIYMGNPYLTPLLVSFIGVWRDCGFLMLIYLAGLKLIPKEYLDTAAIEGANGWHQFIKIKGPLLSPAFISGIILSLVNSLKVFDIIIGLTGMTTSYGFNTASIMLDIIITAVDKNRFGYAMAKSVLLGLVIAFFTGIWFFLFNKGEKKV